MAVWITWNYQQTERIILPTEGGAYKHERRDSLDVYSSIYYKTAVGLYMWINII